MSVKQWSIMSHDSAIICVIHAWQSLVEVAIGSISKRLDTFEIILIARRRIYLVQRFRYLLSYCMS